MSSPGIKKKKGQIFLIQKYSNWLSRGQSGVMFCRLKQYTISYVLYKVFRKILEGWVNKKMEMSLSFRFCKGESFTKTWIIATFSSLSLKHDLWFLEQSGCVKLSLSLSHHKVFTRYFTLPSIQQQRYQIVFNSSSLTSAVQPRLKMNSL